MSNIKLALIIAPFFLLASCNESTNRNKKMVDPGAELAIIYNVLVDDAADNYEVFSMNMDGSDKRNITRLPGVEWSYFSMGDRVFYISDKDTCHRCMFLYETDFRGATHRKITEFKLADSWMSARNNGAELIVRPHPSVDSAFYIIDLNGKVLHRVETRLPFSSDPLFVNNGDQIVFRGGLTKSKLIEGFQEALYIIDDSGKNRRQLTHFPESDTTAGKFDFRAGTPKLHPSGEFVSYQSKQQGKFSLYAVTLDGEKQWKLTDNEEHEGWHEWIPDGTWLAIELFDNNETQFHIGLMNWNTKEMKILTDTSYRYQQSPDFVRKVVD